MRVLIMNNDGTFNKYSTKLNKDGEVEPVLDKEGNPIPFQTHVVTFVKTSHAMAKINVKSCINYEESFDFFQTVEVINSLDRHDSIVMTPDGIPHEIKEYELDARLLPLAQPGGVYYDVGEVSPDLRTFKGCSRISNVDTFNLGQDIEDSDLIGKLKKDYWPMLHVDEDVAGKNAYYAKVPFTPQQFSVFQARFFNQFKSSIGDTINMDEATKPALLEDVKSFIDDGEYTLEPDGTWSHLPITLEISRALYKPYKFSYPCEIYFKEFVKHLVLHASDKSAQK